MRLGEILHQWTDAKKFILTEEYNQPFGILIRFPISAALENAQRRARAIAVLR